MTVKSVSNEIINGIIAETSLKGNREKWFEHGRRYKLDQFGHETMTETVTSLIPERSGIERDTLLLPLITGLTVYFLTPPNHISL